jgi:tetratricopeptide (TPR) repeat protein
MAGLKPAAEVLGEIEKSSEASRPHSSGTPASRLLADLQQFRAESSGPDPALVATRWFRLLDRAAELDAGTNNDLSTYDPLTQMPVGELSLLQSLPPPEAWPALRAEAVRRAAASRGETRALGLRFLTEVLAGDQAAATKSLEAIEAAARQLAPRERMPLDVALRSARASLARLYGDVDQRVTAFRESLTRGAEYEQTRIPDLVAMVGEARATELLQDVALSPTMLSIEGGAATRGLVRRLVIADVARMRVPQWSLVDSVDAAPLYQAIQQRFPRPEEQSGESGMFDWQRRVATLYHFLAMVKDGKQAEAEEALSDLAGNNDIYVPREAVDALQRASLNEPLFRFLHVQLERRPELRAWAVYIEQAAYTGHSADALALVDKLLARKDLPDFVRADLRARRIAALLAADKVDAAVAGYRELLALPPAAKEPGLETRVSAALAAAKLGRLLDRKDLTTLGLSFARKAHDVGGAAFDESRPLLAELRRQGLGVEAQALAIAALKASLAGRQPYEALVPGGNAADVGALTELVGLFAENGRHADVIKLLRESTRWSADDLGELLGTVDSLDVPLGVSVARSLAATGDKSGALRVARAMVRTLPGRDAVYELIAALDGDAIGTFEELAALDEFEERPLIWKARAQLDAGKLAEAEATVRRAIAIDPSDGEEGPGDRMRAYAVLSDILVRKGDTREAELYADAVAAIRLSERADRLYEVGLFERAFKTYREALALFSDAYCIQSRLAVQLNKQGRRKEAMEHYRRAYQLMPDSFGRVESHCFGCESVFQDAEAQGIAETVFTDIIRATPGKAQAHYLLAYLRETQGDHAAALQPLRAAVGIDGRYLNAWKRLDGLAAHTYVEPGERDIARLKLLELDPLKRHASYELVEVGRLAELWRGGDRAHRLAERIAPLRKGVYPLPASAAARAKLIEEMPQEMREQFRTWQTLVDSGAQGAARPPARLLGEHVLVRASALLMGLQGRSEYDY